MLFQPLSKIFYYPGKIYENEYVKQKTEHEPDDIAALECGAPGTAAPQCGYVDS